MATNLTPTERKTRLTLKSAWQDIKNGKQCGIIKTSRLNVHNYLLFGDKAHMWILTPQDGFISKCGKFTITSEDWAFSFVMRYKHK